MYISKTVFQSRLLFLFKTVLCFVFVASTSFCGQGWAQESARSDEDPIAAITADETRIYIAPDDHTDYFWTADDVAYRAAFIKMLDYYLNEIDQTENEPWEYQAKWNCDGSLWLWEYERGKPKADFERLIRRIKDGHISAPMTTLACTFGAQPAEAVLRGMYYAGTLERKHKMRFPIAVSIENQAMPLGLGALWAGSGAKYSWRGICACATKMKYSDFQRRDREVYWYRGLDESRILMKWYSLGNNNASIGGYAEARKPQEAIGFVRSNGGFKKRHPFKTIGLFGQGWDDLATYSTLFPKVAKAETKAGQRVIVSNEEDYFREFERRYGGQLESESLAYGNEWDLYCMSMAEQTSRVRRAVEKLRAAEAMATIVSMQNPEFWSARKTDREQAHMNIGLYWEHDWTADASEQMRGKRANWQRKLADQICQYVERLHRDAAKEFADLLPCEEGKNQFAIFNSLAWQRDIVAEIPLEPNGDWQAFDRDGNPLVAQSIVRDGQSVLLVELKDVPGLAYRVVELRQSTAGPIKTKQTMVKAKEVVLENQHLRAVVSDVGQITSLFDKKTKRELVGANRLNVFASDNQQPFQLSSTVAVEADGELVKTVRIKTTDSLPHTTRISLRENADWIEIENRIQSNFFDTRHWQFDFDLKNPNVVHEEVGAILKARLEKDGGHYAERNARYDWLSLGHFVNVQGDNGGVTIANADCAFFQFGDSQHNILDTSKSKIKILAGGQVDGPKLGIRGQHGDDQFLQRFAIRSNAQTNSDSFDQAAAMRWSLEWQNPGVVMKLTGGKANVEDFLAESKSFLSLTGQDATENQIAVLLWALKPAEEGIEQGVIARAWNVSNQEQTGVMQVRGLSGASLATHIETDTDPLEVGESAAIIKFKPQQMRTVRLQVK